LPMMSNVDTDQAEQNNGRGKPTDHRHHESFDGVNVKNHCDKVR